MIAAVTNPAATTWQAMQLLLQAAQAWAHPGVRLRRTGFNGVTSIGHLLHLRDSRSYITMTKKEPRPWPITQAIDLAAMVEPGAAMAL